MFVTCQGIAGPKMIFDYIKKNLIMDCVSMLRKRISGPKMNFIKDIFFYEYGLIKNFWT